MQCVIFAGGLGMRVMPLTANLPKYLLDISGKPFAHYQLTWLADHGVTDVLLCVAHLSNMIKDYVNDGSKWNLKVEYVDEGNNLLGTAGALRLALDENKLNDSFLILNGDSFLPIDFKKLYDNFLNSSICPAQMSIFKNDGKWDRSNVMRIPGSDLIYYDKRNCTNCNYIDYGVSALFKSVIYSRVPPKQKYCMSTLFNNMSKEQLLSGYEVGERFYEIGSFSGINDFKNWLMQDDNGQIFNS